MSTEREVWTIAERVSTPYSESRTFVYHQPVGPHVLEADFVEVKCGGGINLPGHREKKPWSQVCRDCRAGRKTL